MESQVTRMKIDLILKTQLNQYEQAYNLAREIRQLAPKDQLIEKFYKFLENHRKEMKEIDDQEVELPTVEIQNTDDSGSQWQSDCDSNLTLSDQEIQEDVVEEESPRKHNCCSVKKIAGPVPSPIRNPSIGQIKQLQPKILPNKSSILKKVPVVTMALRR